MKNKILGIFVCMLMITTCVVPVMGELITVKKSSNDINPIPSGTTSLKFMLAGKEPRGLHSYFLHVPPSYDGLELVPLVIVLMPNMQFSFRYPLWFYRSSFMEKYTNFSKKADEEGFIVVYPNQKLLLATGFGPFEYTGKLRPLSLIYGYDYEYDPYWLFRFIDDMGFIQDLIHKMEQEYTINSSRIYVTGFSDGAFMSYSIGAYLSNTVAAIAPVAGSIGERLQEDKPFYCIPTPENPVSVIAFHGTNDSAVQYDNWWWYPSVNESISYWVEHNGCDPTPEIYTSLSEKIIQRTYTNGAKGTEVVLYTIVGGDHAWPGGLYNPIQEISATDLIWEFFEAHPKQ